jgi:hypothetical protein
MKITRGKTVVPRRVMLDGTHGIGKSSWGGTGTRRFVFEFGGRIE